MVVDTLATVRAAIRLTAPAVRVVPRVMVWIDRTPEEPAASWNQTIVPMTAVAGNDAIVAVFPGLPSWLV